MGILSLVINTQNSFFRVATSIFILLYITCFDKKNDKLLVPNMFGVLIFKHIFSNLPLDYNCYQRNAHSHSTEKRLGVLMITLPIDKR